MVVVLPRPQTKLFCEALSSRSLPLIKYNKAIVRFCNAPTYLSHAHVYTYLHVNVPKYNFVFISMPAQST